jgi:hypothetical protein
MVCLRNISVDTLHKGDTDDDDDNDNDNNNNNNNNNVIRNQTSQDKSLLEKPGFRWDNNIKIVEQNSPNLLKT